MAPAIKSIVWTFFQKTQDKKFAVCKLCQQQLKYFAGTSNLKQHLNRKHIIQYNEELSKENTISRDVDESGVNLPTGGESPNPRQVETAIDNLGSSSTHSVSAPVLDLSNIRQPGVAEASGSKVTNIPDPDPPRNVKRKRQLKLYGGTNMKELPEAQKKK
ncbi:unnamed protein product [Acanthoscelides obtectus]|uniref:BED-type domain-containing protein n=1 Tax=Acanthoscelides obtectus TaxID=200917 RepID=A0A9P0MG39_ACAOB|nr:unnamed protein product [Acanthoscelides obtectus]CAK1670193.1 hypothetical protein AOBTE_LOCUS27460 [Acanthoscelides obtectus]